LSSKGNPSAAAKKPRSVFDYLGPVTEPSLGSAHGQVVEPSHNTNPMATEVVVGSSACEIVTSKKARRATAKPVGVTIPID
jgi:hypothetical protein